MWQEEIAGRVAWAYRSWSGIGRAICRCSSLSCRRLETQCQHLISGIPYLPFAVESLWKAAHVLQDMSLTSKYDHTHHSLPEPLLGLASLKSLSVRFPSLTSLQNGISRLTALEHLRIEGLQGTLIVEPGRARWTHDALRSA